MGHKVGGKVERAYTRTTLLDMRRKLMDGGRFTASRRAPTKKSRRFEGKRSGKEKRGDRPAGRQASSSLVSPCSR